MPAILNNSTRALRWPLWLAYDTEIRRRSVSEPLDPSIHHLLIWNELETLYITKKIKEEVSKSSYRGAYTNISCPNSFQNHPSDNSYSFRNQNSHEPRSPTDTIPFESVPSRTTIHTEPDAFSVVIVPDHIHPETAIITHSLTAIHATSPKTLPPNHAVTKKAEITAMHGMVTADAYNSSIAPKARTSVHSAAPMPTMPNHAQQSDFFPVVTPFIANSWEKYLHEANILSSFINVPYGIQNGFNMGIKSTPTETYVPPNHNSSLAHPSAVLSCIQNELSLGRYTSPFSQSRLELLIGPFRTSPLGLVPKAGSSDEFRLIQDLSYPQNDPNRCSINSEIDIEDFRCDWGTFQQVASIVMDAPPFTEAAIPDVDTAFRRCPISPSQQRNFIVMWENLFYIDHNAPFGATSSGGVFSDWSYRRCPNGNFSCQGHWPCCQLGRRLPFL